MAKIFQGIESARQYLFGRKKAYEIAFDIDSPSGRLVLSDLASYCFYDKSTFDVDPRVSALYEGRRSVFLRIMEHINLSQEELAKLRNV